MKLSYPARCWLCATLTLALGLGATGLAAQPSASRLYEEALVRYQENDLEGTLLGLKQALQERPDLLSAHILLARVFMRLREGAAAEHSVVKAQRLGGDPNITWPLRARAMLQQHKFDALLALAPDDGLNPEAQAQVLVYRGRAQLELGKYLDAEATFLAARDLAPQSPAPRVGLATVAFRRDDLYGAEARALAAVRVAPDDAEAWSTRGSIAHALGQVEPAIEAYGRALAIAPEHQEARVSRAGAFLDLRRYDEAAVDVAYLLETFPLDPRSAYLNSVYLAKQHRRAEAREALQRAAALLDDLGSAAVSRAPQLQMLAGIANFELGEFEQAKTYLGQYLDRHPDESGARKILGAILVSQNRPEEAIQLLEPVLEHAPNDHRVLSLLAAAYLQKGRHDIATPYLEKAVKLSAGAPGVRTRLALSRLGSGDVDRGMEELTSLFEEDPKRNLEAGTSLAIAHLKRGDNEAAARIAGQLVALKPHNLTMLNLLGSAQLALGRFDAAQITYERALATDPSFVPARINLGGLAARAGRTEEARQRYEALLAEHPDHVRTMLELAKLESAAGRLSTALRWVNKAQDANPDSMAVALAVVDLHLRLDEPVDALHAAEAAENRAPENLEVLAALARSHLALRRRDVARSVYARMVRIAGFDASKLYGVAQLQLAAGAPEEAAYTLTKALRGDPDHVRVRILLAETQIRLARLGDARTAAEALRDEFPDLVAAHGLLGDAQMAMGEPAPAIASYEKALALAPDARIAVKLFQARVAAGETAAAMGFLDRWVADHPGDWLALRALAESRLAAGDNDRAKALYERLLEADPDDARALNHMAHILDRLGDARAVEFAARARQLAPDNPAVSDTLGWLLVRAGEVERGLEHLRDAHSRASGHPEIRYHIAAALAAMGRPAEARRELEGALAVQGDFEGIADARALLERLGQ